MTHDLTTQKFGSDAEILQQLLRVLSKFYPDKIKLDENTGNKGSLGPAVAGGAPCPTGAAALSSPRIKPSQSFEHPDRVLIEICCGKDSRIGQKTTYSKGCVIIRITIDDDFATASGANNILLALPKYMDYLILVWVSIPCTGGDAMDILQLGLRGLQDTCAH